MNLNIFSKQAYCNVPVPECLGDAGTELAWVSRLLDAPPALQLGAFCHHKVRLGP